jgi:hypothetical protein
MLLLFWSGAVRPGQQQSQSHLLLLHHLAALYAVLNFLLLCCCSAAGQVLSGLVSTIYKATSSFQEVDPSLPPLWKGEPPEVSEALCLLLIMLQPCPVHTHWCNLCAGVVATYQLSKNFNLNFSHHVSKCMLYVFVICCILQG